MPLVRIDVVQGRADEDLRRLADTVHQVMLDVFAAPPGDRYQIVSEHPPGRLFIEDTGLGFTRSDDVTVIQITQQGRTDQQKRDVYAALASRLERDCSLAPEDLVVSITTNSLSDWSFGLGRAQFLEGDL